MPEPTVPPLGRLFALRQFAAFAQVDLGQLAVIADNVREAHFAPNATIAVGDARLPGMHLVLDGRIESHAGHWGPRDVFGLLEILANRPLSAPAISTGETRTLELAATDTYEILEDNFGVLQAVIRGLIDRLIVLGLGAIPEIRVPSSSRLSLVERLIVLRQLAPFVGGRLHALAAVAQGCEEIVLPAGTSLARAGRHAEAFAVVLDGAPKLVRPGQGAAQILRAGDGVGLFETIGGLRYPADVEALAPTRILRCSSATLIDVLEDHTDLGLAIVRNVAGTLLDAQRLERELQLHLS